jgi:hypothetical protein
VFPDGSKHDDMKRSMVLEKTLIFWNCKELFLNYLNWEVMFRTGDKLLFFIKGIV